MDAGDRHYQVVLIWVRDRPKFDEYLRLLPPIVGRYGGAGDRSLRPATIWADGLELPDIVNLVHYRDRPSFERFGDDPAFKGIEHLRSESVDMMSVEGRLTLARPSAPGLAERVYHLELVRYRDDSPAGYRRYEREGEAVMREYGFETEYGMAVDPDPSGARRFDLAKLSYFPSAAAQAAFEKDPRHTVIETELYPSAVAGSVWITGVALS